MGEWLARVGFALTTITGIMPSLASNCHLQPSSVYEFCWKEEMSNPHGLGVSCGIFLTFVGLQVLFVAMPPTQGEHVVFSCGSVVLPSGVLPPGILVLLEEGDEQHARPRCVVRNLPYVCRFTGACLNARLVA